MGIPGTQYLIQALRDYGGDYGVITVTVATFPFFDYGDSCNIPLFAAIAFNGSHPSTVILGVLHHITQRDNHRELGRQFTYITSPPEPFGDTLPRSF